MIDKPQYIIVAGINGAGKSTLYDTFPSLFDKTKRINADELLRQMGGDWHKDSDNLKAMKEEIKQLHYALDHQQSIHVETTLAGRGKAQLNLIDKAHKNGFEVAYSNQAFEFWFLLHFNLYQGALHRSRYEKMLSALLGFAYTKKSGVSSKMFNTLFSKQEQAINHAKTIMKQFDGNNPAQQESSTTVYRLVEELNIFL